MSAALSRPANAAVRRRDEGLPYTVGLLRGERPVPVRVLHWWTADAYAPGAEPATVYHVALEAGQHLPVRERAGRWRSVV